MRGGLTVNKSYSIDVAMTTRVFYCHKCGERLCKHPRTRIVKRGDPDYRKYSRRGHTHFFGDVEVTEYDFQCPSCNRIIKPDEQYVIEKMQKALGKHRLTEEEVARNEQAASLAIARNKRNTDIIVKIIVILAVAAALLLALTKGDFSLKFYF